MVTWEPISVNLNSAIMEGFREENGELDKINEVIQSYREMGLSDASTSLQGGRIFWIGKKSLKMYDECFEAQYLVSTQEWYSK